MKKFFLKHLFIFSFLLCVPFFVFSQSTNPDLPSEQQDAGEGLLPDRGEINPTAPSELDGVDLGVTPPPEKETFPTGSGYTTHNGIATQPPVAPESKNESFPTGSGSTYGTGALLSVPPKFQASVPMPESDTVLNSIVPTNLFGGEPLNKLLNQLFYIGLVAAVILAIVMIIRGGVEYMTIDAIASKENGKNRVKAALGGLLLSFSAILILNTINPGLTNLRIKFEELNGISQVAIEADITAAMASYEGLSSQQLQEILASGKIPTDISPVAQKALAEALNSIEKLRTNTEQGVFKGTDWGNKACAAAVNHIFEKATGQAVGGGASVSAMYSSIQKDPRFVLVPGGVGASQPGDIIISPNGSKRHVGFVSMPGGQSIISNSSSGGVVKNHFDAKRWQNFYGASNTYIYRPL